MNNIKFTQKIKTFILGHKIWSLVFVLAIITGSYFIFFKNSSGADTSYVTDSVEKGDVVVIVSGSGQVEATDSIDINAKSSGDITHVAVKVGQEVKRGDLIATIDSRDAKIALENAEISLAKLKTPDTLTVLQKENSLKKNYSDTWNNISSFVIEMDSVVDGLKDLHDDYLGSQNKILIGKSGKNKIDISERAYWEAKESLEETVSSFKSLSISSSNESIENLSTQALDTSKKISNAVKLAQASLDQTANDLEEEESSEVVDIQEDLTSWTEKSNDYVKSITSNINDIEETKQSLSDTLSGASDLDIRQSELNLETKRNAYNDYFVRAPFDGVISSLTAKVGQNASGSIGTIMTQDKIVTIPLNEVDIAKVKLNQKASLTFDAISDLKSEGEVVEIDGSGTVSSGVVTYNIKISLATSDSRVKPGMTVSATIITDSKMQVLVVPSSAIKTKNDSSYVEIMENGSGIIKKQKVEMGISDDTNTEIISGLNEGDIIVTKTVTGTSSTSNSPSILNSMNPGGNNKSGAGSMRAAGAVIGH